MSQDHRTAELEGALEVTSVPRTPSEPEKHFELSLSKIIAGALAAAGAAVASSWLGVGGTVVGAVVGSIIVPVGTVLASHPLERSSQVIRESLPLLPERQSRPASSAVVASEPASRSAVQRHSGASSPTKRRPIRWGMLAISCLITLVVGFGLLTAAEEVMGRSFSSLIHGGHGGTTLSHVVHGSGGGTTTKPTTPPTIPTTGDQPTTTAPTTDPTTTAPSTSAPTSTAPGTTAPPTSGDPTTTGATGVDVLPSGAAVSAPLQ